MYFSSALFVSPVPKRLQVSVDPYLVLDKVHSL